MGPISVVKSAVFVATLPVRIPVVAGGAICLGVHTFWDRNVTLSSKKAKQKILLNEAIQELKLAVQDRTGCEKVIEHKKQKIANSIRLGVIKARIDKITKDIEPLRGEFEHNTHKLNKYKLLKKTGLTVSDGSGGNSGSNGDEPKPLKALDRKKSRLSRLSSVIEAFPMGRSRKKSTLSKISAWSGCSENKDTSSISESNNRSETVNLIAEKLKRATTIKKKLASYSGKLKDVKLKLREPEEELLRLNAEKKGLGPTGNIGELRKDVNCLKKIKIIEKTREENASIEARGKLEELQKMSRKTRLASKLFGGSVDVKYYDSEISDAELTPEWVNEDVIKWLDARGTKRIESFQQAAD